MGQSPHNQEQRVKLEELALAYIIFSNPRTADLVLVALEPLVRQKSRRCAHHSIHPQLRRIEEEDAAQVARLAIFKALSTWKPERAKFTTWAHQCINNALRELLDVARRKPECAELTERIEPTAPALPMDTIHSRELREAIATLPEREALVIRSYFLEQRTLAEIGAMLGLSQARVGQLRDRALVKLRGRIAWLDPDADQNFTDADPNFFDADVPG